jgi:glycosyltransferase involved in cell wall biosynthesis
MKQPKISILMPCYNVEKYVAEAVKSMLNQTYGDFELIVLDDCSTDSTAEIVKNFADERIVYHCNEQNLGLVGNLNAGLQLAKGELIARMDGDDISLPQRLEIQVNFLTKNPEIALCSCGMELFGNESGIWVRDFSPEDVKITMLFYSPILHASAMWRKSFFADNGLIYRQEAFPAEDYDLWTQAVFYGKLVNLPDVLYRYRIHGIQVTKTVETREKVTRQVQTNFIKRALPSLNEQDIYIFINLICNKISNKYELSQLKIVILHFIEANKKSGFFYQKQLKYRLKRYYQNRVFEFLKKHKTFNIKLLKELRIKQIIKHIKKL